MTEDHEVQHTLYQKYIPFSCVRRLKTKNTHMECLTRAHLTPFTLSDPVEDYKTAYGFIYISRD